MPSKDLLDNAVHFLTIFFVDDAYIKSIRPDMQQLDHGRIKFCSRNQNDFKKPNLRSSLGHVKLLKIKGLKYSNDN